MKKNKKRIDPRYFLNESLWDDWGDGRYVVYFVRNGKTHGQLDTDRLDLAKLEADEFFASPGGKESESVSIYDKDKGETILTKKRKQ